MTSTGANEQTMDMNVTRTNWAGNHVFSALRFHEPQSVEALQQIVSEAAAVRAIGSRHAFNGIADTSGDHVSLIHFDHIELDARARTVTLGGGVTYAELGRWLHDHGYALANLPSLSNITVAGAIQTGTHGSGLRSGVLADAVVALDLVVANGELLRVTRESHKDDFDGMIVALGLLGVVASMTLRVEPTYLLGQRVYEHLSFKNFADRIHDIFASGQSVSGFTNWEPDFVSQLWIKSRAGLDDCMASQALMDTLGARAASQNKSFVSNREPKDFTQQLGVLGPWNDRLPHFRVEAIPERGKEYQAEYFVAFADAADVLPMIIELRALLQPVLQVSEIRAVAADTLWLSPAYGRESLALEFTWQHDWLGVQSAMPVLERALEPFSPRPHWAKMSAMRLGSVFQSYPKAKAFCDLQDVLDPNRKFTNSELERLRPSRAQ